MKRYMKTQKPKYLEKFLSALFTAKDEFATKFLSKVFLEFEMDFSPVPVIDAKKASKIKTPITIFAAERDIIFPGKKTLKRAKNIFPSLKHTELIPESKHVQNRGQNLAIEKVILK